ncbi:MAG: amidase [Chloroflexota bacterium]
MPNLLNPAPLAETVHALSQNHLSLGQHINQMCDRIDSVDAQVEALLPEENRRARLLDDADALNKRYGASYAPPTLYGALVGFKDIFHVDGYVTRAGSQVPPELFAGDEAECVKLLQKAGALIAGKTVTTEFAYFEPGPTRNPHNLAHTPGGSSSGSAAAVAAGLCTLAVGTQTIGSVIRPAAYCGVVGYKPTYDRIPSRGVVYFSRTVDHVGLFTQDVAGMKLAGSVLCQNWRADVGSGSALPTLAIPDGRYLHQTEPQALQLFEEAVQKTEQAGYPVKRLTALDDIEPLNELHRRLTFAEFAQEHRTMYAQHSDRYRPRTAEIIEIGKTVSDDEVAAGRQSCIAVREQLHHLMDQHAIDLWICPPAPGPAPEGIQATGSPLLNLPWTHTGMPAVTIPTNQMINGLPLGIQLIGRFGEDESLLAWTENVDALYRQ